MTTVTDTSSYELYRNPSQAPLVFTATADSIAEESERICHATSSLLDKLVASVSPESATFDNVLIPLAEDEDEQRIASSLLSLYLKVSPDAEVREASETADKKRAHFKIDCWTREDVFRLVDAVFRKNRPLDPESRKMLEEWRRSYIRNGVALPSQNEKERLKALQKRLSSVATEFVKNLDDEEGPVCWLTREELAGVPAGLLSEMELGTGEHDGKLKVVLKGSINRELLRFADNPASRREIASNIRNTGQKNVALFDEAAALRYEIAHILGYANHADFRLEIKMAKTYGAVMRFLEDLRARAIRHREKEVSELRDYKLADYSARGLRSETELFPWDVSYYARMQAAKKFSVDHQKIAEYFPAQPTVTAMLKLFGELFGFVFVEIKDEDRRRLSPTGNAKDLTWHEDVSLYSVWDSPVDEAASDGSADFIGYLYLDLYERPGKDRGLECYAVQLGFTRPNGRRHYPSTLLLTNFPRPTQDTPALLRHMETTSLFHELGHGMHDLAGRSRYARFHGAETVGDFNEAPSQMLENWCWSRAGLKRLSSHYQTGEQLPDDMIEALLKTKHQNAAITLLTQLRMALFDMDVHSVTESGPVDVAAIYDKYRDLVGTKDPRDKHPYTTYRHLFHGYDAGMYSYLWAKTHAMDMFEHAFKENPLDGQVGRQYRNMVLKKGATQDEMKTLQDFLGREPNPNAFLADLGLQ